MLAARLVVGAFEGLALIRGVVRTEADCDDIEEDVSMCLGFVRSDSRSDVICMIS